jgi:hypothetical protein
MGKMNKIKSAVAGAALALGSASASAVPIQWTVGSGGNGHWYDYVSTPVDWNDALSAAAALTHNTMAGYLATVTSAAEGDFIFGNVNTTFGWAGGNDNVTEGEWRWVTGPEAGQVFWNGGPGGSAPGGAFANWDGGEPNNCCGGENFLQINWNVTAWNDHGGPGNAGQTNGYYVEFADANNVPLPGVVGLLGLGLLVMGVARRGLPR